MKHLKENMEITMLRKETVNEIRNKIRAKLDAKACHSDDMLRVDAAGFMGWGWQVKGQHHESEGLII